MTYQSKGGKMVQAWQESDGWWTVTLMNYSHFRLNDASFKELFEGVSDGRS